MLDEDRRGIFTGSFLVVWTFYFLVFAAGYQLFPVVPLRLRELGASLAESGRFQTAFMVGSGFGSLFTGPLGDQLGQRRVLQVASLVVVAILGAYAFAQARWVFYVLAPLHGVLWSALRTASVAKLGGILPPRHLARGMSFFGLAGPGGVAVGPLLGLWLMPRLGFAWMLIVLALVFAVLHLLIGTLPKDAPAEAVAADPAAPGLAGLGVGIPVLLLLLLGVGFGPMPPYSAQEAKALHMAWPSAFLTCFALGMMGMRALISLVDAKRRPTDLLSAMLLLAALGVVILALLPGATVRHVAAGLLYGAGYSMVHTLLFTHLLNTTPASRRGAAVGALFFAFDIGTALGSFSLGYVMEHAGFRWGWSATLLLLIVSLPLSRRLLRLRAEGLGQGEATVLEP